MRYIAFLRSINVGGHVVKMELLRSYFAELGFENVRSYIQTGNIFFETPEADATVLETRIEEYISARLGYAVPAFVRTPEQVKAVFEQEPFRGLVASPEVRYFVLFISQPLPEDCTFPLLSKKNEFEVLGATPGEAFIVMNLQNGQPGNPSAFLEKQFGLKATARFYDTLKKIYMACEQSGAGH